VLCNQRRLAATLLRGPSTSAPVQVSEPGPEDRVLRAARLNNQDFIRRNFHGEPGIVGLRITGRRHKHRAMSWSSLFIAASTVFFLQIVTDYSNHGRKYVTERGLSYQ